MKQIEIIIKIPEFYTFLTSPKNYNHLAECIRKGIVLPKGHKIIDATALQEHLALVPLEDRTYREAVEIINRFPSIIAESEAEK